MFGRSPRELRSRRRKDAPEVRMDMTSMIDVTFLLLVFFMCTLRFRSLEGKLDTYLPRDVGGGSRSVVEQETVDVRLDVVREGTRLAPDGDGPFVPGAHRRSIWSSDREVAVRVGTRTFTTGDLGAVEARLRELAASGDDRPLVIDARAGVATAEVVAVLDRAAAAGFTAIRFAAAP